MFKHKEGCIMSGIEIDIRSEDKYGSSGQEIILNQYGLQYTHDVWTNNHIAKDITVKFNFCPICGVVIEQETK